MNSIALLLWTLAAMGQIGFGATPQGVKAGWKPETDGSMSYIAQVTPQIAEQMATQGQEMALDIPDFLQGRVNRIVWRIGTADVERDPSEAELRSLPPRQVFPRNGENPLAHGGLTTLSDQTTANTVMIDSPRPGSAILPTTGVGRPSDGDPTLPPVPSLAQSYTSPNTRTSLANQLDAYRSGGGSSNNGSASSTTGVAPVLPRTDTLPNLSKPYFGPPLPPTSGYTGGQVTVTGTPAGSGNTNAWNDNRLGSTPGQNGANNSLANGNFGNPNNYGVTGSSSVFSAPSNPSYATNNPPGYLATPSSQNGGYTYPQSNTQYNAVGQENYANANARPDARFASNNFNYGANPYANSGPSQLYPEAPPATQPWNNNYAQTGTNMMPNQGVMPPPVPYNMASNPQTSPASVRSMVDGTRRTMGSRDDIAYENIPATPPSYVVALLLASLVGNAYLVMLLNQLFQRYRALQASSRGSTSLAI